MALTGAQARPDSATSGDVQTTTIRQPSKAEWYASTVGKTVLGEALYRKLDLTSTLSLRNLDFLPNPANWFGANSSAVDVGSVSEGMCTVYKEGGEATKDAAEAVFQVAVENARSITEAVITESANDSGAAAAETAKKVAEEVATSWRDSLPSMPSFSIPESVGVPAWMDTLLSYVTYPFEKAWSIVPEGASSLIPSSTWVTTPLSYATYPFEKAWSYMPEGASSLIPSSTWVTTPLSYATYPFEKTWSYMPEGASSLIPSSTWVTTPLSYATYPFEKAWSYMPEGASSLIPSSTWVTTPLSYATYPFEKAWSMAPEMPSTPEFMGNIIEGGKDWAKYGWTNLTETLVENADWVGPTAAIAVSSAAINHFASSKVENRYARYTLSSIGGVATVWGASQLLALIAGQEYQVGFEKAADIGLRMMLTGVLAQTAAPIASRALVLTNTYVVEPLHFANLPTDGAKVRVS